MESRSLMLLGLLISQSQHGYQIHDFIEKNLQFITDLKKSTAYATLDRLSRDKYIDVSISQEGNRPPRKVYTINEQGMAYFNELLMKNLTLAKNTFYVGDIGLMFIDQLPKEQTLPALQMRLDGNKKLLKNIQKAPVHNKSIGVNLAVSHKKAMLETEMAFLKETINFLKSQSSKC